MKNFAMKAIVVGTSLTLALTGFVYAGSNKQNNQNNSVKTFTQQSNSSHIKGKQGDKDGRGGKGFQMTDEQKAAFLEKAKTTLSEKLASGAITQAQYDTALAEIAAGKIPEILRGNGEGRPELTAEQKAALVADAKTLLSKKLANSEITQAEYDTALAEIEAGTMPEILRGKGFGKALTDEQKTAILEKAKTTLSEKLASGAITQAQYDTALAEITAGKIPEILKGSGFAKPEITEEQKAAMIAEAKAILSKKLASNAITQAEYDTALAEIEAGKMPEIIRGKGFGKVLTDDMKTAMIEKAKTTLSEKLASGAITQAQYDTALAEITAGKLPEILKGNGKGEGRPQMTDEQKAAFFEKAKTSLSDKLASGAITQAQYDTAIAEITAGKIPEILMGKNFRGNGHNNKTTDTSNKSVASDAVA